MIQPIGNRLLVEPVKDPPKAMGSAGIFITEEKDILSTTKCTIVALGTDMTRSWKAGDIVLVPKQAFIEARDSALDKTVAISEDDIIALITSDLAQE